MTDKDKVLLLNIARNSIKESFGLMYTPVDASHLNQRVGSFVTLKIDDALRGCIGYLIGLKPLYQQIYELAKEAAFDDPRFPPLHRSEYAHLSVEISVLTPPQRIKSIEEFVLSRDGIIITVGKNRAVFLPQVADEMGWDKDQMLSALSRKAGLDSQAYKRSDAVFETFQAEVF